MALRKIVTLGDEALRKECKKVDKFNLRLHLLLKDMLDTMYEANGVGLAAPQVSILRRVVVIDVGEGPVELVNPEIIWTSDEIQTGTEGCLSLPGRVGIVSRPEKVRVRAQDRHGNWFEIEGEDLMARALCHELDHLDGRLYIDTMERELVGEELEQYRQGSLDEESEEEAE